MPERLRRNTSRPRHWYSVMPQGGQFILRKTDINDKINVINNLHLACGGKEAGL